jgi:hypothetical protein
MSMRKGRAKRRRSRKARTRWALIGSTVQPVVLTHLRRRTARVRLYSVARPHRLLPPWEVLSAGFFRTREEALREQALDVLGRDAPPRIGFALDESPLQSAILTR